MPFKFRNAILTSTHSCLSLFLFFSLSLSLSLSLCVCAYRHIGEIKKKP